MASLLGTALLPATASCAAATAQRVVVVGAGIAGLGAAVALRSAGYDVVVVEARNRIGGRIHSSQMWPDLPMDLGASWIHGIKGNPVTALAKQAGAELVATSYDNVLLHVDPALRALGVEDSGTEASEALIRRALAWAERQDRDLSLQQAIDAVTASAGQDPLRRALTNFHISAAFEQEYAGSADQLSAWSVDEGKEFDGGDALFPGGYGQIVQYLARGVDVRLNQIVKAISHRETGVTLTLADGSILEADHALVTVPLGVLKAGDIAFNPPLSDRKHQAIGRLGMGLLNKHWLRFDRVHWPSAFDWHEFLSAKKGEWSEWVSLAKVADSPVLMVFSAADHAERVEAMDDNAILAAIMRTARQMFGPGLPDPIGTQFTRWRADPFARGSYSFYAVGSNAEDRKALSRTEQWRLHFAGEAQSLRYPGTVHGALLSGRAAAARIISGGGA